MNDCGTTQSSYQRYQPRLLAGQTLASDEAAELMEALLSGTLDSQQIAAVLTVLATRLPSADELSAYARTMRSHALMIDPGGPTFDTCGTGGSGLSTVNTSTLSAFVLAAAGVRVAKHGNRAASGRCGSIDVLEQLGVNISLSPSRAQDLLQRFGVVLLFAPRHHPALGPLAPIRRSLGFRTVFNLLGPLCNPAGAERQLLGVSDAAAAPVMAEALVRLGTERACVVAGAGGLDELSLTGPSQCWEVREGAVHQFELSPANLGLSPVPFEAIAGGDPEENTRHFSDILSGAERGPRAQHTALNAGAALYVAGVTESFQDGYRLADELLASGRPWEIFEAYRDASHEVD